MYNYKIKTKLKNSIPTNVLLNSQQGIDRKMDVPPARKGTFITLYFPKLIRFSYSFALGTLNER